jgi:hypothetical protein
MKTRRDLGLDNLKAIAISFVMFWHLQPIRFINSDNQNFTTVLVSLVNVFNWQVTLTAVPIFYIISLYLFFRKSTSINYLKKRLINIGTLFIFWTAFHILFTFIATSKLSEFSWRVIIGIHPTLPLVGDSVFYFLFDLFFLVILAYLYQRLYPRTRELLNYFIVGFSLIRFELSFFVESKWYYISYYSLENFIIYIPIAFAIFKDKDKIFKFKFFYLATYIIFSLHDILLGVHHYDLGIYNRISLVFGALTLFCFIYPISINNWYTQKLAKYSLGLFALHKYWQYILIWLSQQYLSNVAKFNHFDIKFLIISILAICLTVMTIALLKLTILKYFVC